MSIPRVAALATNTVRQAVRSRLLYTLLFFGLVLIATSVGVSSLSYVESERIVQDVGLAAIRLFGVGIAIFVGVGLIHDEIERRTIYTMLSKPLSRSEFIVGKYMGLLLTVWAQLAIMSLAFLAVSWVVGAPLGWNLVAALGLVGIELMVVVAVATFFSSFTTPLLSSLFSVGIYLAGNLSRDIRSLGFQSGDAIVEFAGQALYRALPDLQSFNLTVQAVHGLPISSLEIGLPVVYGVGYSVVLLMASALIFERRDLR
ncbi:MAG: ABC transporter permease [Myxococcota bacterium]|nr:ABC transporter permease [Myxococcota bacterium]